MNIERIVAGDAIPPDFEAVRGLRDVAVEPLAPGVTCLVAREDDRALARLSLHVRDDMTGAPGRSGLIGHYEAASREAGVVLLAAARRELVQGGALRVLGPMNGSTWARYRLALDAEPGDAAATPPWFTGEPRNPFDYPAHFEAAGFHVCARYESRIEDLAGDAPDASAVAARVADAGFALRPLDLERFDDELGTLFALSLEAFADNLYYTPIPEAAFRAIYLPLRSRMDPEFVLVAVDREQRPCGFLFAFADPLAVRDGRAERLIAKTVAVAPRARGHGVANRMLDVLRSTARARGMREVVHALMHVANFSMRMSGRQESRVFRRYALWEWTP
jgi:GNAT superfamily N-acetyltransferase